MQILQRVVGDVGHVAGEPGGRRLAATSGVGVSRVEDLIAWQRANDFKLAVYQLLARHPRGDRDLRFRDQLRGSAVSVGMNVAEGFYRYRHPEFAHFLSVALGSLGEAERWLHDGADRGHYPLAACDEAFRMAKRCRVAMLRLRQSLGQRDQARTRSRLPRRTSST